MFKALQQTGDTHTAGLAGPIDEAAVGYTPGVVYKAWDATPLPVEAHIDERPAAVPAVEKVTRTEDGGEVSSVTTSSDSEDSLYKTEWTLRPRNNKKPQWKTELEETREQITDPTEDLKLFPRAFTYALGTVLHENEGTRVWEDYTAAAMKIEPKIKKKTQLRKLLSYMDAAEGMVGSGPPGPGTAAAVPPGASPPRTNPDSILPLDSKLFNKLNGHAVHSWASHHVLHLVHQLSVVPCMTVAGVAKEEFLRNTHWKQVDHGTATLSLVDILRKTVLLLQERKAAQMKLTERLLNAVVHGIAPDDMPMVIAQYGGEQDAGSARGTHGAPAPRWHASYRKRESSVALMGGGGGDQGKQLAPAPEGPTGGLARRASRRSSWMDSMPRTKSFEKNMALGRAARPAPASRKSSFAGGGGGGMSSTGSALGLKRTHSKHASMRKMSRAGSIRHGGGGLPLREEPVDTPDDLFDADGATFDFRVYNELAVRACHMVTWERTRYPQYMRDCGVELDSFGEPPGECSALSEVLRLLSPAWGRRVRRTSTAGVVSSPARRRKSSVLNSGAAASAAGAPEGTAAAGLIPPPSPHTPVSPAASVSTVTAATTPAGRRTSARRASERDPTAAPFSMVSFVQDVTPVAEGSPRYKARRASHAQQPLFVGEPIDLNRRRSVAQHGAGSASFAGGEGGGCEPDITSPLSLRASFADDSGGLVGSRDAPPLRLRYTTRAIVRRLAADVARRPLSHVAQPIIDFLESLRDGYTYIADIDAFFTLFGPFSFSVRNFLMFARLRSFVPYFNPELAEERLLRDDAQAGAFVTYPHGFDDHARCLGVSWVEYVTEAPGGDASATASPSGSPRNATAAGGWVGATTPGKNRGGAAAVASPCATGAHRTPQQEHEDVFGVRETFVATSPVPGDRGEAFAEIQYRRRPRAPSSLSIGSDSWAGGSICGSGPPGWPIPSPPPASLKIPRLPNRGVGTGVRRRSRQLSRSTNPGIGDNATAASSPSRMSRTTRDSFAHDDPFLGGSTVAGDAHPPPPPVTRKVVRQGTIRNCSGVIVFSHGRAPAPTVAECIVQNNHVLKTPMGLPYDIPWMYDGLGDGLSPLHRAVLMNRPAAVAAALEHETFVPFAHHGFRPHTRTKRGERPFQKYVNPEEVVRKEEQEKQVMGEILMRFEGAPQERVDETLAAEEEKKAKRSRKRRGNTKTARRGSRSPGLSSQATPGGYELRVNGTTGHDHALERLPELAETLREAEEVMVLRPKRAVPKPPTPVHPQDMSCHGMVMVAHWAEEARGGRAPPTHQKIAPKRRYGEWSVWEIGRKPAPWEKQEVDDVCARAQEQSAGGEKADGTTDNIRVTTPEGRCHSPLDASGVTHPGGISTFADVATAAAGVGPATVRGGGHGGRSASPSRRIAGGASGNCTRASTGGGQPQQPRRAQLQGMSPKQGGEEGASPSPAVRDVPPPHQSDFATTTAPAPPTQGSPHSGRGFAVCYGPVDHTTQQPENLFTRLTRTEVKYLLVDLLGLQDTLDDNAFCKIVWDWGIDSDEDLFDYCTSQDFPEDHPLNVFHHERFETMHRHEYATRLRRAYLDFVAEYYETRANNEWTALHMAIHTEQATSTKILELLFNAEADPNRCDSAGRPPLFYAILKKDLPAIRYLLAHDASYTHCGEPSPLLVALDTKNGDPSVDVVRLLAEVCPGGSDIDPAIACCNQRISKGGATLGPGLVQLFTRIKRVLQGVRRERERVNTAIAKGDDAALEAVREPPPSFFPTRRSWRERKKSARF